MNSSENRRFVRIDVQLVLEVEDPDALRDAARARIAGDSAFPDAERGRAEAVVTHDTAEALAYLVDPFDLVSALPGIELTRTTWSAEHVGGGRDSLLGGSSGDDAEQDDDEFGDEFGDDFDDDRKEAGVRIG
jgi:hypothetical protein